MDSGWRISDYRGINVNPQQKMVGHVVCILHVEANSDIMAIIMAIHTGQKYSVSSGALHGY